MGVIFDFIIGLLLNLVGLVFSLMGGILDGLLGLEKGTILLEEKTLVSHIPGSHMMQNFFSSFPLLRDVFDAFVVFSYIIIALLLMFGILKNLFGPMSKTAENPFVLTGRSILAGFAVRFSPIISGMFLWAGASLYIAFNGIVASPVEFDFYTSAQSWIMQAVTGGSMFTAAASVAPMVFFFIMISLFTAYMKLLLEVVERYVTMCVMALVSPFTCAALASGSTTQYFFTWVKMMISQVFLMIFSTIWLNAINHAMQSFSSFNGNQTNPIGFVLLLVAFIYTGQKIDRHMSTLGLTTAQGGDFGMGMFQAYHMTRDAVKGFNRKLDQAKAAQANKVSNNTYADSLGKNSKMTPAGANLGKEVDKAIQKNKTDTLLGREDTAMANAKMLGLSKSSGSDNVLEGMNGDQAFTQNKKDGSYAQFVKSDKVKEGIDMGDGYKMTTGAGKSVEDATGQSTSDEKLNAQTAAMNNMTEQQRAENSTPMHIIDKDDEAQMARVAAKEAQVENTDGQQLSEAMNAMNLEKGQKLVSFDEDGNKLGELSIGEASTVGEGEHRFSHFGYKQGDLLEYRKSDIFNGLTVAPKGEGEFFKNEDGSVISKDTLMNQGGTTNLVAGAKTDDTLMYGPNGSSEVLAGGMIAMNDKGQVLTESYNDDGSKSVKWTDTASGEGVATYDGKMDVSHLGEVQTGYESYSGEMNTVKDVFQGLEDGKIDLNEFAMVDPKSGKVGVLTDDYKDAVRGGLKRDGTDPNFSEKFEHASFDFGDGDIRKYNTADLMNAKGETASFIPVREYNHVGGIRTDEYGRARIKDIESVKSDSEGTGIVYEFKGGAKLYQADTRMTGYESEGSAKIVTGDNNNGLGTQKVQEVSSPVFRAERKSEGAKIYDIGKGSFSRNDLDTVDVTGGIKHQVLSSNTQNLDANYQDFAKGVADNKIQKMFYDKQSETYFAHQQFFNDKNEHFSKVYAFKDYNPSMKLGKGETLIHMEGRPVVMSTTTERFTGVNNHKLVEKQVNSAVNRFRMTKTKGEYISSEMKKKDKTKGQVTLKNE